MRSKLFLSTLTLTLALGGGAVIAPIPSAMAQNYLDRHCWVEEIGHGCPDLAPYGCGLPYPPVDSCYFSPHTVIVVPVDCPTGSPCYYPYSDPSFEEGRARSSDQRFRNDSFQGFEGTQNRPEAKEFQADRRERFERRQPTTARPEIELESPFVQPGVGPNLGNPTDQGVKSGTPDVKSDLQGGWEFDDSSHDDHAGHDHSAHDHAGNDHDEHDHGYSTGK